MRVPTGGSVAPWLPVGIEMRRAGKIVVGVLALAALLGALVVAAEHVENRADCEVKMAQAASC